MRFLQQREVSAVLLIASTNFNTDKHIYESIGFEFGVMTDMTKLYIMVHLV